MLNNASNTQNVAHFVARLRWDLGGVADLREVRFLQRQTRWTEWRNITGEPVSVLQHDHRYHIHTRLYYRSIITSKTITMQINALT